MNHISEKKPKPVVKKCERCTRRFLGRTHSYQWEKEEKQFKISVLYSAALSYIAIIQNRNLEVMQNSEFR